MYIFSIISIVWWRLRYVKHKGSVTGDQMVDPLVEGLRVTLIEVAPNQQWIYGFELCVKDSLWLQKVLQLCPWRVQFEATDFQHWKLAHGTRKCSPRFASFFVPRLINSLVVGDQLTVPVSPSFPTPPDSAGFPSSKVKISSKILKSWKTLMWNQLLRF